MKLAIVPRLLLVGLLVVACLRAALAQELTADVPVLESPKLSFEELVGREFDYDISFLWFDKLARGRFSLLTTDRPGVYRAVLEARTLGVAAWLTQERVQSYVAVMVQQPDGRLRSLTYESRIMRRKGGRIIERTKRFTFDQEHRQVRIEKLGDGKIMWQKVLPMTGEEPPSDILTAYFNFRDGFYGPIRAGGHYLVPTFSRKGTGDIRIDLLRDEQRQHLDFFPPGGLVARIKVDPEIFDSKDGGIYVWFDDRLRPVRGIVENVIGLGDVRGIRR